MLRYPEDQGEFVATISFDSTETDYFFSPANQPGASVWPAGSWEARVRFPVANSRITLAIALARVSGSGVYQADYASLTDPQTATGLRVFGGTTVAQPGATSGDRLRVECRWVRDNTPGGNDATVHFGDPANDFLEVPILMGNPSIVWNGNTLAFPHPLTAYGWRTRSDRQLNISGGGVAVTGHRHAYDEVRAQLARFEDALFAADLRAWWAWARRGGQYAFALDAAEVVNLALNGAAAAGQKDIPLADTSSVVVGKRYLLREAAGDEEEIIKVASITTNVKAVADVNLKYGYLTGDVFRSLDYFPKVISLDSDIPLQVPGEDLVTTYTFDHLMREDKG
jgi:hypothetical protein